MIWKHYIFKNELLTFCNEALNGLLPSVFSKSSIFPTPKKGDLNLPLNYIGITLTAISAKIYNSLLLNRISEHIEPILRRNQNGLRKGRSTLQQILALRRIIEEIHTSSRNTTLVSIGFSKAFDSVNRKTLLHIHVWYPQENYSRHQENLRESADLCSHSGWSNRHLFNRNRHPPRRHFSSILVCNRSRLYTSSISDNIRSKGLLLTPRRSTRHPCKYITDLDYADDIALTPGNLENAPSLSHSLERAANIWTATKLNTC